MAREAAKYEQALGLAGFRVVRTGKHTVWRHPDGRQWATSRNVKSGDRGTANLRADLRRLGVELP